MTKAFETLQAWNFFDQLRYALATAGLPDEEKIGVGAFFVMISRFRQLPLRLAIQEKTEGSTDYIVKKVSQLLEPGAICNIFSPAGWSRFVGSATQKIAYLSDWTSRDGTMRVRTDDNSLVRLVRSERDGRVVEEPQQVDGNFVCISGRRPRETSSPGRWLTISMPDAPWQVPTNVKPLDEKTASVWVEAQRLFEKRAKMPVVLPDWADVFVHQTCRNEYSSRCLPAFLEAWKTMTLVRSFRESDRWEAAGRRRFYVANFEDLAETGALVRGIYREGRSFPSLPKVMAAIPVGPTVTIIDPLTGKAKKYKETRSPVKLNPLLADSRPWE